MPWGGRVRADPTGRLDAVQARHVYVRQYDVRLFAAGGFHGLRPVRGLARDGHAGSGRRARRSCRAPSPGRRARATRCARRRACTRSSSERGGVRGRLVGWGRGREADPPERAGRHQVYRGVWPGPPAQRPGSRCRGAFQRHHRRVTWPCTAVIPGGDSSARRRTRSRTVGSRPGYDARRLPDMRRGTSVGVGCAFPGGAVAGEPCPHRSGTSMGRRRGTYTVQVRGMDH